MWILHCSHILHMTYWPRSEKESMVEILDFSKSCSWYLTFVSKKNFPVLLFSRILYSWLNKKFIGGPNLDASHSFQVSFYESIYAPGILIEVKVTMATILQSRKSSDDILLSLSIEKNNKRASTSHNSTSVYHCIITSLHHYIILLRRTSSVQAPLTTQKFATTVLLLMELHNTWLNWL